MMSMLSILPIIAGLAIIECLLSIDNALVLAAMVSHLPQRQQKLALRLGLAGAYIMRGLCMFFVNFLITHWWIRIGAAFYLLYLMCKNLSVSRLSQARQATQRNFFGTVLALELTDLAFSTDNIVTAVAFSSQFWAVCVGVFIGIAAIRLAAGWCIQLMKNLPVFASIAYVLVGSVGAQLLAAQVWRIELSEMQKLILILVIIATGIIYDRSKLVNRWLKPIFTSVVECMAAITLHTERLLAAIGSQLLPQQQSNDQRVQRFCTGSTQAEAPMVSTPGYTNTAPAERLSCGADNPSMRYRHIKA